MRGLFRHGMRAPRNPEPPPEFISQFHDLIKGNAREQNAAIVRAIHDAEAAINRKLEKIMHTLDDLLTATAAQRTKIDSLVTLTKGLHQRVLEAMGSTLTPSQQDRIDRIFGALQDNADALDSAITENTVHATKGAISDGPSASDIKTGLSGSVGAQGSTDPANPGNSTGSAPDGGIPAGSDKAPA